MELKPKEFQSNALTALREFFAACGTYGSARLAYYDVAPRWVGFEPTYHPVEALGDLPYVCVRIPTGGGKTFVACHAVGVAQRELLSADRCLALWLVPTTTILEQTLAALKNPSHPYRLALESGTGPVEVLRLSEALNIQRSVLDAQTVVIVSTIQAIRTDDKEGRKVYEQSGRLMTHFGGLDGALRGQLALFPDGSPITSLENVFRLRTPVVIVDEAQNVRTDLSFEALARLRPSCILEFTATPETDVNPSNVLFSASAAQLKADEMIKMPVMLETRANWSDLLSDAKAKLDELDKLAKADHQAGKPYLRPIMLLQAQPKDRRREAHTVEALEKCLLEDIGVPKEEVRRSTGEDDQLGDEDLLSPDSKVRFIITVQKLREGWDCQFAYVLFTVAELSSPTAVEQILGRVLRQPGAARRDTEALNRAYAFATSAHFQQAATSLREALVQNGFNKLEAKDMVQSSRPHEGEGPDLFSQDGLVTVAVEGSAGELPISVKDAVSFDRKSGTLTVRGEMTDDVRERLREHFSGESNRAAIDRAYVSSRRRRTSAGGLDRQGILFVVPVLAVKQGDLYEPFDESHLLAYQWDLAKCNAELSETEYASARPEAAFGELDVDEKGKLHVSLASKLQAQAAMLSDTRGWNAGEFARWLDKNIPHHDITLEASGIFLVNALGFLVDRRGIPLEQLLHDKFRLRRAVEAKIDEHRREARSKAHQLALLPDALTPLVVDPNVCFKYDPNRYPYSFICGRSADFRKHFYEVVGDLEDKGEEFECAQYIDGLDEVKCWVRNTARHERDSFWLQTATDKFYPDFVCLLNDGRILVVEYKGADRWDNPGEQEKNRLGQLWEARSNGKCLFVMPKGKNLEAIRAKIAPIGVTVQRDA
jgi:type III restriction enzyme